MTGEFRISGGQGFWWRRLECCGEACVSRSAAWIKHTQNLGAPGFLMEHRFSGHTWPLHVVEFLYSLPLNKIDSSCSQTIVSCSALQLEVIYILSISKFSLAALRGLKMNAIWTLKTIHHLEAVVTILLNTVVKCNVKFWLQRQCRGRTRELFSILFFPPGVVYCVVGKCDFQTFL